MHSGVLDAMASLRRHASVSNVIVHAASDGVGTIVSADIDTNMPSTWKAQSSHPHGVRPVETVEIYFPADYPNAAPYPSLRPDFDANLPHINPHRAGDRVPPCIYQGSLLDALHNEGFDRFVVQLVDWLQKAGEDALIDPAQGWEPTRRDGRGHTVCFDIEGMAQRRPRRGGLQLFRMTQFWRKDGTGSHADTPQLRTAPAFWGRDLRDLLESTREFPLYFGGPTLLGMCWPTTDVGFEATPDSHYRPDTVSNFGEMLLRADEYGCKQALERFMTVLNDAAKDLPFVLTLPVYVGLVVKRPFHLIGMTTDYEILLYRLTLQVPQGIIGASTNVDVVPVLSPVSAALLRRTSAMPENVPGLRTTFLGCGSLGSKLVMHLTRAGFAPELLIDHANFMPHNAARHTLMPSDVMRAGTKADVLAALVQEFNSTSKTMTFNSPVQSLPLHGRTRYGAVLDPDAIVVNTTGSTPVRHFLTGSAFRARTVEACLTDGGRIGVMTLEGPGRNPSSSDLIVLTYDALRRIDRLRGLQQSAANTLQVGVGCNSVTLPMSDARISLIAAGIGQSLLTMQVEGFTSSGKVSVGAVADDGMSVQWQHAQVGPTHIIAAEDADGWAVRVLAPAHAKIVEEVQRYPTVETGGVIVGRVTSAAREIVITDVLPAPDDSVRSPALFVLGTNGRTAMIDDYEASGAGALWCLGTWHSHLEDVGPSAMDQNTATVLRDQMDRLTVLLIRRPTGYSVVVRARTP